MNDKNVCFLLGVMPRSGTNYLANLINCHNNVAMPGPIWEDFFISNSNKLSSFISSSFRSWNPSWDKERKIINKRLFLSCLGSGLLEYLNTQRANQDDDKLLLTKTPTVRNLKNYFDVFPNNKLIILVRDGRSLIASGEKSFAWDFEKACKDWARGINTINQFMRDNAKLSNQILLVKYEDIYTDTHKEISRILNFLELEHSEYNWEEANEMGVSGSSEAVDSDGHVSWTSKVIKSESFNPLERFNNWPQAKKNRFSWLAGNAARSLDYDIQELELSPLEKGKQVLLDVTWPLRVLPKALYHLLINKKFILKPH